MIKLIENKYSLSIKDIEPIITLIQTGQVAVEIPKDIEDYLKAIVFMNLLGANIDDWECILADNIFNKCTIDTALTGIGLVNLNKHIKALK